MPTRYLSSIIVLCTVVGVGGILVGADPWYSQTGLASYYGKGFAGQKTASGERYSPKEMTAAHRSLPLGTKVMVKNSETDETVEVKINDRGPYVDPKRRIIDLSRAAADSIGFVEEGVGRVQVAVTERPRQPKAPDERIFYEIQVGSFEEREHAELVLDQVRYRYPNAYIVPRDGPSGPYYRVRIGPFAGRDEAQRIANALKRGGHRVFLDELPESALPQQARRAAGRKTARRS